VRDELLGCISNLILDSSIIRNVWKPVTCLFDTGKIITPLEVEIRFKIFEMKFDQFVEKGNEFLKEVAMELGMPDDTDQAYRVMSSVFHTVRETISAEESLHLISQLPMFIKAVYVNSWHLNPKNKIRSRAEFFDCLRKQNPRTATQDFGNDEIARAKTQAVFKVIKNHVATGEIQDILDQLPMELAELWITQTQEYADRKP